MSVRICVSYQTDAEIEPIDRQLRALRSWRVRSAPPKGRYARRYYDDTSRARFIGKPVKTDQLSRKP